MSCRVDGLKLELDTTPLGLLEGIEPLAMPGSPEAVSAGAGNAGQASGVPRHDME